MCEVLGGNYYWFKYVDFLLVELGDFFWLIMIDILGYVFVLLEFI